MVSQPRSHTLPKGILVYLGFGRRSAACWLAVSRYTNHLFVPAPSGMSNASLYPILAYDRWPDEFLSTDWRAECERPPLKPDDFRDPRGPRAYVANALRIAAGNTGNLHIRIMAYAALDRHMADPLARDDARAATAWLMRRVCRPTTGQETVDMRLQRIGVSRTVGSWPIPKPIVDGASWNPAKELTPRIDALRLKFPPSVRLAMSADDLKARQAALKLVVRRERYAAKRRARGIDPETGLYLHQLPKSADPATGPTVPDARPAPMPVFAPAAPLASDAVAALADRAMSRRPGSRAPRYIPVNRDAPVDRATGAQMVLTAPDGLILERPWLYVRPRDIAAARDLIRLTDPRSAVADAVDDMVALIDGRLPDRLIHPRGLLADPASGLAAHTLDTVVAALDRPHADPSATTLATPQGSPLAAVPAPAYPPGLLAHNPRQRAALLADAAYRHPALDLAAAEKLTRAAYAARMLDWSRRPVVRPLDRDLTPLDDLIAAEEPRDFLADRDRPE